MELLTVYEAAKVLRVNPITVRRHIADGRLRAVHVGRRVRVPQDALEEFVTPVRTEGPEAPRHYRRPSPRGKTFTKDDPLMSLVGIGRSGLSDVSENKHKYLAEAYNIKAE